MMDTIKLLENKEKELENQLADIRKAKEVLKGLAGDTQPKGSIDTVDNTVYITKESLMKSQFRENPNLKPAFDAIIPVITDSGSTLDQIEKRATPLRKSLKSYSKSTVNTYLSCLRAAGFIKLKGDRFFIN
jgi:hypothetical protein